MGRGPLSIIKILHLAYCHTEPESHTLWSSDSRGYCAEGDSRCSLDLMAAGPVCLLSGFISLAVFERPGAPGAALPICATSPRAPCWPDGLIGL